MSFASNELKEAAAGVQQALEKFSDIHDFEVKHLLNCNRTCSVMLEAAEAKVKMLEERQVRLEAQDQLLIDHDKYRDEADRLRVELAQAHLKIDGQSQQIKALADVVNRHGV